MSIKLVKISENNAVNIMRGTRWCNPFVVGKDGSTLKVFQLFGEYVQWRIQQQPDWLKPLKGKKLYCCCKEGDYCHGKVLLKYVTTEIENE